MVFFYNLFDLFLSFFFGCFNFILHVLSFFFTLLFWLLLKEKYATAEMVGFLIYYIFWII